MKIASIDNNYNSPKFQALIIKKESLPALKTKGQAFINKLATAGKEFKDYKHFDMKIEGESPKTIITSKDGKTVYKDMFVPCLPYTSQLVVRTKIGNGDKQNNVGDLILDFDNKTEALNAYKQIHQAGDKNHTDYAIEITKFLEQGAIKKQAATEKVDTSGLTPYLA